MLTVEQLESRDLAAADLGAGRVALDSGLVVTPYPDWVGTPDAPPTLNVAAAGGLVYVGAGVGGGPRLSVWNPDGTRNRPDVFVGAAGDRSGLVPVVAEAPAEAPVTVGTGRYRIYLDGADAATTREVAGYFRELLDLVTVTNARPDAEPNSYLTVVFGAPLGYAQGYAPAAVGLGGLGIADDWAHPTNAASNPDTVWVQYAGRSLKAAQAGAHEAGHALGLSHAADPRDVMAPVQPLDLDAAAFGAAEVEQLRGVFAG